ncbi:MAG: GAF domain-containing protein [Myxococcales bacterium]|nr:GAF domain-containing protein [Myxococcales bacterium]
MDDGDPRLAQLQARNQALEARVRDLGVINAFATSLLHVRAEVDDILWDVANEVVARMGLEDCVIYLLDEGGDRLVQRAAYGPKNPRAREIKDPITIPTGQGIVGTVAATGVAERIDDVRLDPRYITDDASRLSELAVPIVGDRGVIGVIDTEHSQLGFFMPHHEDLLATIASMTASRLQLAELHLRLSQLNRSLEEKVEARTAELRVAHARSEQLLLNVLPAPVASRLEAGEQRIAERFDDVAVLFADLVGFTNLAAGWAPEAVVELLEQVFTAFDEACVAHGCEKVKTIGDAWMAVCGVPEPVPDALDRLVRLALRLLVVLEDLGRATGIRLQVRIGVHLGPVVAGVIGRSKFAWDLWGDTVNVASRLESQGLPGRVHVTSETAGRLVGYRIQDRGEIALKGIGRVRTAVVLGEEER